MDERIDGRQQHDLILHGEIKYFRTEDDIYEVKDMTYFNIFKSKVRVFCFRFWFFSFQKVSGTNETYCRPTLELSNNGA